VNKTKFNWLVNLLTDNLSNVLKELYEIHGNILFEELCNSPEEFIDSIHKRLSPTDQNNVEEIAVISILYCIKNEWSLT